MMFLFFDGKLCYRIGEKWAFSYGVIQKCKDDESKLQVCIQLDVMCWVVEYSNLFSWFMCLSA